MSIEVNPVLPVPKFIPGRVVEYQRPDGDLMPVRIGAACIQASDSDPDVFQISYLCEWVTNDGTLHRMFLPQTSLWCVGEIGDSDA